MAPEEIKEMAAHNTIVAYCICIPAITALTVWVARSIHKNTRPFLLGIFPQHEQVALAINNALLLALANKFPFFRWYSRQPLPVAAARKLYRFISFNRRIILPGKKEGQRAFSSTPDFNLFYRSLYIFLAWVITSLVLTSYSSLLRSYVGPGSTGREFLVCGGQVIFQSLILLALRQPREILLGYLGNMMTISLAGALALLPALAAGRLIQSLPPLVFMIYFLLVAALMLAEHLRRMKLTGLPLLMSATWVLYRMLMLIVILILR